MKLTKSLSSALLIAAFLAAPFTGFADQAKSDKDAPAKAVKAKAYPLKTCVVSGDKLGGDMGEPYVFTYKGREIKMCCKDCRKEFDKNPAKYIKKLEAAEKQAGDKK
jgi:YHS domain-containing protein